MTPTFLPVLPRSAVAIFERRRIRILGEEQHRPFGRIRGVDSGRRHDQPLRILDDARHPARVLARRHDPHGLLGDRVLAVRGSHLPTLGLAHDLGGDRDDVAVLKRVAHRIPNQSRQVVTRDDLGDPLDAPHLEPHRTSFGRTSRPKTSSHSRWLRPTLWR